MDAKLTIKLNKELIDRAKGYASSQKRSLPRIIESYHKSLVSPSDSIDNEEIKISAFVKSMTTGDHFPVGLDLKKEYSDYLSEKYK